MNPGVNSMEVCVCVYLHAQMLVSKEVVVFMCVQRGNIKDMQRKC